MQGEKFDMYSLIIAEDEYITRNNLVNKVPWNELGFRVDAQFSDGKEVLEYLKNNTPDVILTDIKMTSVDGTEVARFVAQHKLPIKVVFLSGYRDFSYAQEAVEYQVVHYILKPVVIYKLKEVFQSLREKMDEQRAKEQRVTEEYNYIVNYEKQQFVLDAYFGVLRHSEKLEKRLSLLGDKSVNNRLYFVKIIIQNDQQYKEFIDYCGEKEFQEQMVNILESMHENVEFYPITWRMMEGENPFILGVLWENDSDYMISPSTIEGEIKELMPITLQIPVFYSMSSPKELVNCAERSGSSEGFEELMKNVNYLSMIKEQNMLLASYLTQNDRERGMDIAGAMVQNFLKGGIVYAQQQCIYTVIKLLEEVKNVDSLAWNQMSISCIDQNIFSMTESVLLKSWLRQKIESIIDFMDSKSESRKEIRIKAILNYIHLHYAEDISLYTLAENVFLNPSYVSRLIKEQTGKNYTEIITELRIEKAEELLENTDLYIYEIAQQVGYNNLNYFYKSFRKVKGKLPGDYRIKGVESGNAKV